MKKITALLAIISLSITACRKEDKGNNDPLSLLTGKSWKPAMTDKNPGSNPSGNNLYHAVLNCEKDDSYRFGTNNKLAINRGKEKCNSNEGDSEILDYSVDFNNKTLTIQGRVYTLAEVSTHQLKYHAPAGPGPYNQLIFILEH